MNNHNINSTYVNRVYVDMNTYDLSVSSYFDDKLTLDFKLKHDIERDVLLTVHLAYEDGEVEIFDYEQLMQSGKVVIEIEPDRMLDIESTVFTVKFQDTDVSRVYTIKDKSTKKVIMKTESLATLFVMKNPSYIIDEEIRLHTSDTVAYYMTHKLKIKEN